MAWDGQDDGVNTEVDEVVAVDETFGPPATERYLAFLLQQPLPALAEMEAEDDDENETAFEEVDGTGAGDASNGSLSKDN